MSSVNKVIIVGRLGQDPEVRQFQNGGSITNISVATSERWTDKNTGEQKEQTEWHRVSLQNRGNYRLGDTAAQYLRKGSMVYIEGSLHTRKYTDQQGIERYSTEIRANNMVMLGGNTNGQNHQDPSGQPYHGGNNYNAQGNNYSNGYNNHNNNNHNQGFNQQGSAQWGAQNTNFEQGYQQPQGGFNPQYPNSNSVQGLGHAPQGMGGMNSNVANQGMSGNQFTTPPSAPQGLPKGSGVSSPNEDDIPF